MSFLLTGPFPILVLNSFIETKFSFEALFVSLHIAEVIEFESPSLLLAKV